MTDPATPAPPPISLAGALWIASVLNAAPDFPGRDTLMSHLRRFARRFDVRVRGRFGPGLRYEGNPGVDSNTLEPMLLRYAKPELAPILEASLGPGGFFVDLGANVGVYTLWAAACVGREGRVVAFEPVPETRQRLERNLALNDFPQVEVVPMAVGATPGRTRLFIVPGASGLSSHYRAEGGVAVEVDVTTLDRYVGLGTPPALLKIDVEGMELEVLKGASGLLRSERPPLVVFEAHPQHMAAAGTSYAQILGFLQEHGYRVFALARRGIRAEPPDASEPASADVLAARPDVGAHRRALETLRSAHFSNQEQSAHTRLLASLRRALHGRA